MKGSSTDYPAINVVDNERIRFWKSLGLLQSVPRRLLAMTGWLKENADTIVVTETEDGAKAATIAEADKDPDYSIIFRVPSDRTEREYLKECLRYLRKWEADVDHCDEKISQREKEGKSAEGLRKDREWILRKRAASCSRINAFLDTLRFDIADMGLGELRYQASSKKALVEEWRKEMDND